MQSLKFKDKVKKKVKEFLAVTLISSSILVSNVSCDNKEEDIYGDHPIVDVEQTDKDTTNVNDNDKDIISVNDKDNLIDDENSDSDLTDEDELLNDEETDEEVDDINCVFEEPDEEILSNENTGTKYIVSSEAIRKEYEKDCFDYVKLAKLIGAYCESSDKIDIETPSGKCYVPFYMTGNSPFQGTSSCKVHILFLGIEGSIKQGSYKANREIFNDNVILLNKYLVYSYIMHKYLKEEDIRNVVTYPYDNIDEKYLIPNYNNKFEFNGVPYRMLNEHLDVLHEMEFINELNNKHTRYKFSTLWLYNLNGFPLVPLDLMKCPIEDKEASLAVLGFLPNNSIVTNDQKYQKHISGECDEYYMERTQELIDEIEGN